MATLAQRTPRQKRCPQRFSDLPINAPSSQKRMLCIQSYNSPLLLRACSELNVKSVSSRDTTGSSLKPAKKARRTKGPEVKIGAPDCYKVREVIPVIRSREPRKFLVHWDGYSTRENSFVDEEELGETAIMYA